MLSLELIAGRDEIWLPARWRRKSLAGAGQRRFVERLLRTIRRVERLSRPRGRRLLEYRAGRAAFGAAVFVL